ncbi:MAG: DUF1700 domain-containing protein [Acholeplasmataceae bacterium]|nr:DUF1700 domain-containing protein [Acholeplasmataceae bacterium]
MKTWMKELERGLKNKFYDNEVQDILSYYEEIINDRLSNNEKIEDIVRDYDIQKIVKDITPEVLMKRPNKSYVQVSKSTRQLIVFLLSSPFLIPLGIVYISLLIFVVSMIFTAWIVLFSAVVSFGTYIIELFQAGLTLPNFIGVLGFGLMVFAMMVILSLWLYQMMIYIWKKLIYWFSKLITKRGESK